MTFPLEPTRSVRLDDRVEGHAELDDRALCGRRSAMGLGNFNDGQIELWVAFRFHATDPQIEAWADCLEKTSKMLFYATNGTAQFAKIVFVNDYYGGDEADAFVRNDLTRSHVEQLGAFGQASAHMELGSDAVGDPFIVIHELGHHIFGLGDEYSSANALIKCTANQNTDEACIMSVPVAIGLTAPTLTAFCDSNNHVSDNGSSQNDLHNGLSCADVILANPDYDIQVEPWTGGVAIDVAHNAIAWEQAEPGWDISVVLDLDDLDAETTSAGTLGAGPLGEPLLHVPNHFEQILQAPDALLEPVYVAAAPDLPDAAAGPSSIVDGIQVAREAIAATHRLAATQAIVLFTWGQDRIADADRLGAQLAGAGIRVLAVGLGPNRAELQQLALRSRGTYDEIDPKRGFVAIRNQVLNLADQLRFGAPIVEGSSQPPGIPQPIELLVEEGSKGLAVILCHEPREDLRVTLESPNGRRVPSQPRTRGSLEGGYYELSERNVEPGIWKARVHPPTASPYILTAYSDNPEIYVGVNGLQRLYEVGNAVTLYVVVDSPMPVAGLALEARATSPDGRELVPPPTVDPRKGGAYAVSFEARSPGPYEVTIDIRNEGDAFAAGETPPDAHPSEIPKFRRTKRFQVHAKS